MRCLQPRAFWLCISNALCCGETGGNRTASKPREKTGPANIRVNAILPSVIEGPRIEGVIADRAKQTGVSPDEMKEDYINRISLWRMAVVFQKISVLSALWKCLTMQQRDGCQGPDFQ